MDKAAGMSIRKMMLDFKDTGKDVYFEIQITNDDPSSDAGSQTITLLQCNIDSGVLAKFDASSDSYLDEDVSFTFDDFDMPKEFALDRLASTYQRESILPRMFGTD